MNYNSTEIILAFDGISTLSYCTKSPVWYNMPKGGTQNILWLLAVNRMFTDLCECNEHRKTKGFEVRVYVL